VKRAGSFLFVDTPPRPLCPMPAAITASVLLGMLAGCAGAPQTSQKAVQPTPTTLTTADPMHATQLKKPLTNSEKRANYIKCSTGASEKARASINGMKRPAVMAAGTLATVGLHIVGTFIPGVGLIPSLIGSAPAIKQKIDIDKCKQEAGDLPESGEAVREGARKVLTAVSSPRPAPRPGPSSPAGPRPVAAPPSP